MDVKKNDAEKTENLENLKTDLQDKSSQQSDIDLSDGQKTEDQADEKDAVPSDSKKNDEETPTKETTDEFISLDQTEQDYFYYQADFTVGPQRVIIWHEMTLGDLVISTLLLLILIFNVLKRFVGGR